MLQPLVRRTWAPVGQTPIHTMSSKHDRLSVISAITVSPNRRRLGFYFCIYDENINADGVVLFLRWIQRHIQRNLLVVWDRLNAHRTAERRIRRRSGNRIHFEYLPSYSPELNPVEQVWCHSKWVDLSNHLPHDVIELSDNVFASLAIMQTQQQLLRSFFDHAGLPL